MQRRIAFVLLAVVVGGCTSSPSPLPPPSHVQSSQGPGQSIPVTSDDTEPLPTFAIDDPRYVPPDFLTAPADPLTVTPTLDTANAVTTKLPIEGGSLAATGADGTKYTLSVPANLIAFETSVTMTPITEIGGLPDATSSVPALGVNLEPNGLELAGTATLTITPSRAPTEVLVALESERLGDETGFRTFEQSGDTIRMSIGHFSTYSVTSITFVGAMRPSLLRQMWSQTQIEARFRAEVALRLGLIRQNQLLDVDEMDVRDFARALLAEYKRFIISPRVAVADRSCADAQAAMAAYLEYQQQRQLLGVGDDEAFDIGAGSGTFVPRALLDVAVQRCFDEAYTICTRFGDIRGSTAFYITFFGKVLVALGGEEVPAEYLEQAVNNLRRCGRWRLTMTLTHTQSEGGGVTKGIFEMKSEIDLQWTRGTGGFGGILDASIVGSGKVTGDFRVATVIACQPTISNVVGTRDASAYISDFEFGYPEGPLRPGEILPPIPKQLTVVADLGRIDYDAANCRRTEHGEFLPFWSYWLAVQEAGGRSTEKEILAAVQDGSGRATFGSGWEFKTEPFEATLVQGGTPPSFPNVAVVNEIELVHTPR